MGGKQRESQQELAFMKGAMVKPEARLREEAEPLAAGGRPESQAGNEQFHAHDLLCLSEPPWYGSVCRVVWEGEAVRLFPIPINGIGKGISSSFRSDINTLHLNNMSLLWSLDSRCFAYSTNMPLRWS